MKTLSRDVLICTLEEHNRIGLQPPCLALKLNAFQLRFEWSSRRLRRRRFDSFVPALALGVCVDNGHPRDGLSRSWCHSLG
jgi:hypothetical protein